MRPVGEKLAKEDSEERDEGREGDKWGAKREEAEGLGAEKEGLLRGCKGMTS